MCVSVCVCVHGGMSVWVYIEDVSVGVHGGCQCGCTWRMSVWVYMEDVSVGVHGGCQCGCEWRMSAWMCMEDVNVCVHVGMSVWVYM